MKKRRSTEQIVGLLRQADVDLGKGMNVPDVCRRLGVSQQTYSLGGPGTDAKRWSRRDGSEYGEATSGTPKVRPFDHPVPRPCRAIFQGRIVELPDIHSL
jgi:hypothetical protein